MNQFERDQVDALVFAYWTISFGIHIDELFKGPSQHEKFIEACVGTLSFGSGVKPDITSVKADRYRRHYVSEFMKYAERVFNELNEEQCRILICPEFCKRRGMTEDKLTPQFLADYNNLSYDAYRKKLSRARAKLLLLDKKYRSHIYPREQEAS